jgi:hypothetical protein
MTLEIVNCLRKHINLLADCLDCLHILILKEKSLVNFVLLLHLSALHLRQLRFEVDFLLCYLIIVIVEYSAP